MKILLSIITLSVLAIAPLRGQFQESNYRMKALGKEIGYVTVSRQMVGKDSYYRTKSLLEVNLIFKKIRMEVDNKTHYREGKLNNSDVRVIINGDLYNSSLVKWVGSKYLIQVDEEALKPLLIPISYSGSLIYFQEPISVNQVFSESSGQFMSVKKLQRGQYSITDTRNNREVIHTFENGKLVRSENKHPLVNVYVELIDPAIATR